MWFLLPTRFVWLIPRADTDTATAAAHSSGSNQILDLRTAIPHEHVPHMRVAPRRLKGCRYIKHILCACAAFAAFGCGLGWNIVRFALDLSRPIRDFLNNARSKRKASLIFLFAIVECGMYTYSKPKKINEWTLDVYRNSTHDFSRHDMYNCKYIGVLSLQSFVL